jgi:ABC-2 type transport system ATP-binding protein
MSNAIEVSKLTKKYKNFLLDNINFNVPSGYICGFIGQNGAGKTTTLKLILNMALKDNGAIKVFGQANDNYLLKQDIGVLFDQPYFQEDWNAVDIEKAMSLFFKNWDSDMFHKYLTKFSLNPKQKFKVLSRGMKMKLGLAVALSHNAKLLLLDEPTSGLDPVMRDEILDILREYMVTEDKTIFFSTHITSDLERIADYIIYIHKGKVIYSGLKDDLINKYCIIRGGPEDLSLVGQKRMIGCREHFGGFEAMIEMQNIGGLPSGIITENVTLDDIMIFMNREEHRYDS